MNIIPKSSRKDDEVATAMSESGVVAVCVWSTQSQTKPPVYGARGRVFQQYDIHVRQVKLKPSAATLKSLVRFAREKDGAVVTLRNTTLFRTKAFWDTLGATLPIQGTMQMYLVFATSDKQGLEVLARNPKWRATCMLLGIFGSAIFIGVSCLIIGACCWPSNISNKDFMEYEDIMTGAILPGEEVC